MFSQTSCAMALLLQDWEFLNKGWIKEELWTKNGIVKQDNVTITEEMIRAQSKQSSRILVEEADLPSWPNYRTAWRCSEWEESDRIVDDAGQWSRQLSSNIMSTLYVESVYGRGGFGKHVQLPD